MLFSKSWISGLMSNLIKKSWTVSNPSISPYSGPTESARSISHSNLHFHGARLLYGLYYKTWSFKASIIWNWYSRMIETFPKKSRYLWFSCADCWGYQKIFPFTKKYLLFLFSGCICSPWNRPTSVTCENVQLDVIPQDLPPLINRLNLKGTIYILGQ